MEELWKDSPPQNLRHQGRQKGRHRHELRERHADPEQRALGRARERLFHHRPAARHGQGQHQRRCTGRTDGHREGGRQEL